MANKNSKTDAYQIVTDRVIQLMEQGTCPWHRPWHTLNAAPKNFHSDHQYSGINWILLNALGFEIPFFMTFKQVKDRKGSIRKGSKGLPVVYWNFVKRIDESGEEKKIPFLKTYKVFNCADIEGIEFPCPELPSREFNPIEAAEKVIQNWKDCPPIKHGSNRACYHPDDDKIAMPNKSRFKSDQEYYSVMFHEMAHATGHRSRLKRLKPATFGSKNYGKEELVAEMTSAFLCAHCGIDNSVIENQAAYLKCWINTLKGDPRLIITAATAAQKAANYILNKTPADQSTPAQNDRTEPRTEQLDLFAA
ncbi:MAG: zincin-like metallopeptidase domain-containing protein [Verrucomicrobiota bacterium]